MSRRACSTRSSTSAWTRGLIAAVLLLAVPSLARASGEDIRREVLVLYNSAAGQTPTMNLVYEGFQTILNHYGLIPRYVDASRRPLPSGQDLDRARGIITAFNSSTLSGPADYLAWLDGVMDRGLKIVILREIGVPMTGEEGERLAPAAARLRDRLGYAWKGSFTSNRRLLRWGYKDPSMAEYERKLPPVPETYEHFVVQPPARARITVRRTDMENSESSMVATGPAGGFARDGFIHWQNPTDYRKKWYLNPFKFIEETLQAKDLPVPDPTTLSGLRVAFSHIDADGFSGPTRLDRGRSSCGEVIRDEILKKFPFPVTVSFIVAEIDPNLARAESPLALARDIAALPNVETASHTYSHPFYWDPDSPIKARYDGRYGFSIPGYTMTDEMEIDHSVRWISDKVAPKDLPCRVIQWSGDCMPTEAQIARADAAGILNINGGDTLLDQTSDSLFSVAPLYRRVGTHFQIHIGQANDNILTNLWEGPYYGYRDIVTTMERTGSPRRLKPVDVYYHFFSGERHESLRALQDVYAWVLAQDLVPVFTSAYIEMVRGSLSARLKRDGDRIVVEEYGRCLTVRLPPASPDPDLGRSENVQGFVREEQGLFVSLEPGRRAVIALGGGSPRPHLRKADGFVEKFGVKAEVVSLDYRRGWPGAPAGRVEIGGFRPGAAVRARGTALAGGDAETAADEHGVVVIRGLAKGSLEVTVR